MSLAYRDSMSIKRACLALAAIGCQVPDGDESQSTATSLAVTSSTVQTGRFEQPDFTACCTGDQSCSGNNPSSPYARVRLPPAPGQTVPNPNADPDGTATSWRLRQDEAVVIVGRTPPSARYYGFTPYLSDRYDATIDARRPLFASLGDTWNQLVLTTAGPTPFESPFAIIFTSNATTAQLTRLSLVRSGLSAVNVVVLPAATTVLGLDDHADTFSFYLRIGVPDDAAAAAAWLANPPAVYRVTPASELAPNPLAAPAIRPRGTGVVEGLSSAVNALGLAIRSRVGGAATIATQNIDPAVFNGDVCIANKRFCAGDNRDALYGSSAGTFDLDAPGRYVMVFGVDHAATGKASYSNATISYNANSLGVVAVDSTMMAGSAAVFLPNHPARDSLYAFALARDCSVAPTPFCITVPSDGCPVLPIGAAANLTFRAYLEPATATGPAYGELVVDRALLVN
jgi:hypothetical protein